MLRRAASLLSLFVAHLTLALTLTLTLALAQTAPVPVPARPAWSAFDVATIKPTDASKVNGRYLKLIGTDQFVARNYTLKLLIAAAYELNPKTISGGPAWVDSDHFDVDARTPADVPPGVTPTHAEQMRMLRALLVERFGLKFERQPKEFAIYAMELAKGGAKLKPAAAPGDAVVMGPGVVFESKVVLPGRNATVNDLASLLQRAILDRPVVDRTGLTGRYDFDLTWAPDESQFHGDGPSSAANAPEPPLFTAMQQQLGLTLRATRGEVSTLVIDGVARPAAN